MTNSSKKGGKLERTLGAYGLEELEEELPLLWQKETGERQSVRDLTNLTNRRIVESVLDEMEDAPPGYSAKDIREQLWREYSGGANKEPDPQAVAEIESWFEQQDKPPKEFTRDFVSYSTVHSYLTNYADAEAPAQKTPEELIQESQDRIGRTRGKTRLLTQGVFDQLARNELFIDGGYEISVQINVTCEECGRQTTAMTAVTSGGCPYCSNSVALFGSRLLVG